MRILHIDETFHPKFGYQCNPLAKFQQKSGDEVYIIAPEKDYIYAVYKEFGEYGDNLEEDDREYTDSTGVKIVRVNAKGMIVNRLNYDMRQLLNAIDSIKPEVIMVHCIETLTAMRLVFRLQKKYPMVFDSHMLAMASRNRFSKLFEFGFKHIITPQIIKNNYMVVKTQNDDYVNTHLGIPDTNTKFISFGTDTVLFQPSEETRSKFLADNGMNKDAFVIVSTGKLSESKGGMLLAECVHDRFITEREVVVVVVANLDGSYEQKVKEILEESSNKILFYPVQKYSDLPFFYQIADVTVFPKQCSMSFYDAQACKSVVITEKGKVNEDRCSHGNGLCFECNSVDDFRHKIQTLIDMPEEEFQAMRQNGYEFVTSYYSYDIIAKEYTNELICAIKKYQDK